MGWFGSKKAEEPPPPPAGSVQSVQQLWSQDPLAFGGAALAAGCGGAGVLFIALKARSRLKRIPNAAVLTPDQFARRNGWVKGKVTSVGDADGFRIYHTPFPSWLYRVPTDTKALKGQTISIRLGGVDAPELPHFGNPGQPYAVEAQDSLKAMVDGKRIWVQLLKRDRYERCVGAALYRRKYLGIPSPFWSSVQRDLAAQGLAVVYDRSDAVYGTKDPKATLEAAVAKAQRYNLGMWSKKNKGYESPAEYKRRTSGSSSD